jgi:hypothetical protein
MKKAYYYFFYKIYRSIEFTSKLSGAPFLTFFKAGLVMITLEVWVLLTIGSYYSVYTKKAKELSIAMPGVYIPLLVILVFNYYTLDYKETWRKYNFEFSRLSRQKDIIGGWIVSGIIIFIIANLIIALYLMNQIDWHSYK